jgi:drug/metabolite transporter (DMT)-like permease
MTVSNWLKLVVLAILWGGSFVFVEFALEGFGPLTLVLLRVSLAALTLWIVAFALGHRIPTDPRQWGAYVVMGIIVNVLPFTLIAWGQQSITAGVASILTAAVPLFTVLIAHRFGDERISGNKLVGVVVGFLGVSLLMMRAGSGFDFGLGQLAVLVAALCYSVGAVYGKRLGGHSPLVNAAAMMTCAGLMLAPAAFLIERPLAMTPGMSSWIAVIALAELSSALAFLLYFAVLRSAGATFLSLVTFLIPIVSTVLGFFMLGERLGTIELLGMGVIFLGVAVLNPVVVTRVRSVFKGGGSKRGRSGGA